MNRIENFPSNSLYKYYKLDELFDKKRLSGEIYFSNPFQLNDPYDCQLNVINNINEIANNKPDGRSWIKNKLLELDLEFDDDKIDSLFNDDQYVVEEVRKAQLEKLGIFCSTKHNNNMILWAYYTNHEGYCIEYDVQNLIQQIVVGIIDNMNQNQLEHLLDKKRYDIDPLKKEPKREIRIENANQIFKNTSLDNFDNCYLKTLDERLVINLVKNFYVKRFGCDEIKYVGELSGMPTLFFDSENQTITSKYYSKLNIWDKEDEFRIIVSLGGKKSVKLKKETIKSIRLGCFIDEVKEKHLLDIIKQQDLKIPIYKMKRGKYGLEDSLINS